MADPTLEEVDAFIAEYKTLHGFLGDWQQHHGWNWSSRWGLIDPMGVQNAELVFEVNAGLTRPSISAIFRKCLVYRVDIVPMDECKYNDYGAHEFGLPPRVCGPHTHPWLENRLYVQRNGFGQLPNRRPIEIQDVQFGQPVDTTKIRFIRALEVAVSDLNIGLLPSQRECEPPRQTVLFAEKFL